MPETGKETVRRSPETGKKMAWRRIQERKGSKQGRPSELCGLYINVSFVSLTNHAWKTEVARIPNCTMASNLSAKHVALLCYLSLLLPSALGAAVVCEELPAELCAFAVSSSSRRCVLENTQRAGRPTEYQCRTSEVVVKRMPGGLVETDGCMRACGVDRATVGISSDSLLEPRAVAALCSFPCFHGCPNIVDLYSNLAAGEGVVLSDICEAHRTNPRRAMTQLQSSGMELGTTPAASPPESA